MGLRRCWGMGDGDRLRVVDRYGEAWIYRDEERWRDMKIHREIDR